MTIFEKLLISHLVGDWLFQTNWMAMNKTDNWKVRFVHCLIYSMCFFWLSWSWIVWLFATHFVIDTYRPLYWFRKLKGDYKTWDEFKASFSTPAGFVVNVTYDQIFHILTFIPIASSLG